MLSKTLSTSRFVTCWDECRIETGATLLNKSEVKTRREGNRLEVRGDASRKIVTNGTAIRVRIGSWNSSMLAYVQAGDRLNEWRT